MEVSSVLNYYNIHPLIRIFKGPDILLQLAYVCLPAFLCEVLVNYARNIIRIRLNNCNISWKQREFLHGLHNLQRLVSVGTIRRFIFIFLKIKTLVEIRAVTQMNHSSTSIEVLFHGLPSKRKCPNIRKQIVSSLSWQLTVLSLRRAICREVFSKHFFASIFVNF